MAAPGKSSTNYYKSNRKALLVKRAYQRKYNKKPSEVKRRVALKRINRKKGTYGNGDGKDVSHKKNGRTFLEIASKNRARNRSRA
mgnify:CR=1 FL=1